MKMKNTSKYILMSCLGLMLINMTTAFSYGQEKNNSPESISKNGREAPPEDVTFSVRVVDSTVLISGKTKISLWGIEKIKADATVFHLKVRSALEKKIGGKEVLCTVKSRPTRDTIKAQCINSIEEDLSLFLLQQGYVSADRTAVYGSIYETPYLNAEKQAQTNGRGAWAKDQDMSSSAGDVQSKNFMMGAFFLMAVFIMALGVLSFYIMRGFGRVVDIQNQSIDLAVKERTLKEKEKFIIATMIDAEVKSNKAKIEAYLMVYEETLLGFTDADRAPKYKKTGEIVQKQPALSRSVFDGNTHKLDLLGSRMASSIIHYYARIKTSPDYIEITPDMPQDEAHKIIQRVVENAKKLDKISDDLLDEFVQHALIKRFEA